MSVSASSRASELSSIQRRNDFRRDANGYLGSGADDGGGGFGISIANDDEDNESSIGRKLYPYVYGLMSKAELARGIDLLEVSRA